MFSNLCTFKFINLYYSDSYDFEIILVIIFNQTILSKLQKSIILAKI